MKIRIKSNYLTRYVLQDYGNKEALLTFYVLFLVFCLFTYIYIFFVSLLLFALAVCVFSILFYFFSLLLLRLSIDRNLWICSRTAYELHMEILDCLAHAHTFSHLIFFGMIFDFHSTFIPIPCNKQEVGTFFLSLSHSPVTHILLRQMIALRFSFFLCFRTSLFPAASSWKRK